MRRTPRAGSRPRGPRGRHDLCPLHCHAAPVTPQLWPRRHHLPHPAGIADPSRRGAEALSSQEARAPSGPSRASPRLHASGRQGPQSLSLQPRLQPVLGRGAHCGRPRLPGSGVPASSGGGGGAGTQATSLGATAQHPLHPASIPRVRCAACCAACRSRPPVLVLAPRCAKWVRRPSPRGIGRHPHLRGGHSPPVQGRQKGGTGGGGEGLAYLPNPARPKVAFLTQRGHCLLPNRGPWKMGGWPGWKGPGSGGLGGC